MRIETFHKHILKAFIQSFQKMAPVRVLLKIVDPEVLLLKLPSNVLIQSWLPHIQVLSNYCSSITLFPHIPCTKNYVCETLGNNFVLFKFGKTYPI